MIDIELDFFFHYMHYEGHYMETGIFIGMDLLYNDDKTKCQFSILYLS